MPDEQVFEGQGVIELCQVGEQRLCLPSSLLSDLRTAVSYIML